MLAVAADETSWTDDRIDDLARRVETGFEQVDRRFGQVHADIGALREEVQSNSRELRASIERSQGGLRGSFERGQTEMRGELGEALAESRQENAEIRAELRGEIKALGDGLNERFDKPQRILLAASLGGICALIAAALTFLGAYLL